MPAHQTIPNPPTKPNPTTVFTPGETGDDAVTKALATKEQADVVKSKVTKMTL